MKQNSMLAMILAGGRGSRLHDLTNKVAKPAVSYGGKYRIVDFPLSNCANSGIDVVGVLTQYESVELNSYVAAGGRWGLDSKDSGVYVLPPREKADAGLDVYRGTADAISQNIDFIDQYAPEYLLVLSGDHIYKMNYDKMLDYHKERQADATLAVIEVPLKEASRFGIMNTDGETDRITEFVEKPPVPQSNLASMGIYIFNWKLLRRLLLADMKNPESSHDFGKDIIPTLLGDDKRLCAYRFKGYWKDVGTIDSLWEANMDLLSPDNELDLSDLTWKIYTEDVTALPQYIGAEARIQNAYITQGCVIEGEVTNSVVFTGAKVRPGAKVIDSVLMPGAIVEDGAVVIRALVANGVNIGKGALVGSADSEHIVGELMKGFVKRRPVSGEFADALRSADPVRGGELAAQLQGSLPAIALTGHISLSTAFSNDVKGELTYAQQLYGYGRPGDVFIGISTSGNAKNIMYAVAVAKAAGIRTIGLTGKDGGELGRACDVSIVVPEHGTLKIHELHLPVYHALCLKREEHFKKVELCVFHMRIRGFARSRTVDTRPYFPKRAQPYQPVHLHPQPIHRRAGVEVRHPGICKAWREQYKG